MGQKFRVGLIYEYNENWIGGTYYVQNLILALCKLPENQQPNITVYCSKKAEFRDLRAITGYRFLEYGRTTSAAGFIYDLARRVCRRILSVNLPRRSVKKYFRNVDVLFPGFGIEDEALGAKRVLYWITDFQEHYLPEYFSESEVAERKKRIEKLIANHARIVFSSYAALADFNRFFPLNNLVTYVLPFAVTLTQNIEANIELKYQIVGKYFLCSNQFWAHKNHATVFEAVSFLKSKGKTVQVVFTGKEHDYRNPAFFNSLMRLVERLNIIDSVRFLGFIKRTDQLALMSRCVALIQPSLFEGWSSSVEDAKALGTNIIASDISVHLEQLIDYPSGRVFRKNDSEDLACQMEQLESSKRQDDIGYDYDKRIEEYGSSFIRIIESMCSRE